MAIARFIIRCLRYKSEGMYRKYSTATKLEGWSLKVGVQNLYRFSEFCPELNLTVI